MKCNQLIRLVKEWHTHVRQETMAPARMMQFIDNHVNECKICREDQDLSPEIERVRDYVLPDAKLPKISRSSQDILTPDIFPTVEQENDLLSTLADDDTTADGLL